MKKNENENHRLSLWILVYSFPALFVAFLQSTHRQQLVVLLDRLLFREGSQKAESKVQIDEANAFRHAKGWLNVTRRKNIDLL